MDPCWHQIEPHHLDGVAALVAADRTAMCKRKGEKDTEFVKRIVCAYINAAPYSIALREIIFRCLNGETPPRN